MSNCKFCHSEKNLLKIIDDFFVCQSCYKKRYSLCLKCGEHFFSETKNMFLKECFCPICKNIKTHFYTPKWNNFGYDNNCFIGIELEENSNNRFYLNDFLNDCNKINNNFIFFKSDSSIGRCGVEIVSHPASYNYHRKSNDWKTIFLLINKNKIIKNKGCGLHFHINKTFFSNQEITFLDLFINNKSVSKFISKIGGRHYNGYCKRIIKKNSQWGISIKNRYCALNLENSKTIEFRFCKSTIEYNTFIKRLNLIYSIICFCKEYINLNDLKHKKQMFKSKKYLIDEYFSFIKSKKMFNYLLN